MMEYRDIPGYKYPYRCTEDGQVFANRGKGWEPVAVARNAYGLQIIHVVKKDGRDSTRSVPRLLWEAFRGPIEAGRCVIEKQPQSSTLSVWNLEVRKKQEISAEKGAKTSNANKIEEIREFGKVSVIYSSQKVAAQAAYLTPQALRYRLKFGVKYQLKKFGVAYRRIEK